MADQSKAKVLVVDDEPDAVEFVRAVLEEAGYEVISASDGVAGLATARAESPDVVILDVQMPGKDGFTVFSEMAKDEQLGSVPVIMLTGVGQRIGVGFSAEAMGEYYGTEPAAYVEKPVDPAALQEAVQRVLSA
jgi:CheY-like chemotaxis protein